MPKNKVLPSLIAGLFLSLSAACGNNQQEPILAPVQTIDSVNSLAKTRNPNLAQITVATYNIRNLFDGVQNAGKAEEKAKPEAELKALSDAIHAINADVIALEEVESKATLKKFAEKYLADLNYEVILREANDPRGIDVAVLSRLPVLDIKSHKNVKFNIPGNEPGGFSRDLLQVKLKANNNYNFTLFTTHLKSQHGGDQADVKRRAEAMKIRQFIRDFEKQNPRANYIVAGDFNDVANAPSLAPLLDPRSSGLNLHDIINEDLGKGPEIYTYHPKKYRSRIDYLLVSPGMHREYQPKSVNIHKFPAAGEKWTFFEASDHLPVTARFNVAVDKK